MLVASKRSVAVFLGIQDWSARRNGHVPRDIPPAGKIWSFRGDSGRAALAEHIPKVLLLNIRFIIFFLFAYTLLLLGIHTTSIPSRFNDTVYSSSMNCQCNSGIIKCVLGRNADAFK